MCHSILKINKQVIIFLFQYNDIALLTLDSPVKFSKQVRSICLPQGRTLYAGKTATVIGWGSLRESKATKSQSLSMKRNPKIVVNNTNTLRNIFTLLNELCPNLLMHY